MNIAVYISGRSKLYDKWLVKQLENKESEIDVFCSFNEPYSETNHNNIMSVINPVSINWEEYNLPDKWMNVSHKHESTKVKNMCSMFYNNKKAFEFIEAYSNANCKVYDLVVKFRPDIMNENFPRFFLPDENNIVYTPDNHIFGWPGINDMIAFGSYDSMKIYSILYDHIDEYINKTSKYFFVSSSFAFSVRGKK